MEMGKRNPYQRQPLDHWIAAYWQINKIWTADLEYAYSDAEFDEPDTSRLTIGAKVKVVLEAYPEIPFNGSVEALGQSYKNKSYNNPRIVFDVIVALDKIDQELMRPGMKVKLELEQGENS